MLILTTIKAHSKISSTHSFLFFLFSLSLLSEMSEFNRAIRGSFQGFLKFFQGCLKLLLSEVALNLGHAELSEYFRVFMTAF